MIDNFSRRILAWNVSGSFEPAITAQLLRAASDATATRKPTVLVDGGIENFNSAVDEVVASGVLKRVLAQTEIDFAHRIMVADIETSVAVLEPTRQRRDS